MCAPAGRARVGGVVEDLELGHFQGGVDLVEEAQCVDPTSLGRLQRVLVEGEHPILLVLAHRPLSETEGWWLERLTEAARLHAVLYELALPSAPGVALDDLDPHAADLVVAAGLLTGPISIPVAARMLGMSESDVVELGESLAMNGRLGQARGGSISTSTVSGSAGGESRAGYVGSQSGTLHLIDITSSAPELVCEFDAREAIMVNPTIVDPVVYVSTNGQTIWTLPVGACEGRVPDRQPFYVAETPINVAPAIVGDTIYLPTDRFLYARDLRTYEFVWPADKVTGTSNISASPVVTDDTVYFAEEDGVVHAADRETGDFLWSWQTGLHVRGAPAVANDAVFVVSGDGFVYALGG